MDFLKDLSIDKIRNAAEDAFNQAKPKTEVEARVYEALSHKNWGSSSTLMNEIARDSYDYDKFAVISQIMWESMENQRPAAWRVVFKGLTLLEHLIKNGSERCVDDARNHGHCLRALHQFNYYEGTVDRGLGVREKSKQLVDLLSDDEQIREERQKARQLREKFGGNLGGVTGGGGGGSKYSGYGNDSWDAGGGGGYGNGGIGSAGGRGRYGEDRGGYGGRYDNDRDTRSMPAPAPAADSTPTFASIPDETKRTKSKKTKKKKKAEAELVQAEPQVDLFSFDDAAPAPAPSAGKDNDDFGDFAGASPPAPANDPFASAPVPQQNHQFDAFAGSGQAGPQQQNAKFDAFGGQSMGAAAAMNNATYGNGMSDGAMIGSGMMQQKPMGGGGMNQSPAIGGSGVMSGGKTQQTSLQASQQEEDDEFGAFAAAGSAKAVSGGGASSDPMSRLISLDGLSKNSKKEDKLNQPIIVNEAAAQYVQEKDQIAENVKQASKGSSMSFEGIDGLHKSSMGGQMQMMPPSASMGMNPSVMGSGGGADAISGLDPSTMMRKPQREQMPQQGGMMGNQQGFGGMQGMNPQQMGMMNPHMMGSAQGMQGMGGMQGGVMNQQQMMMNQQQMMGGMQGGMQSGMQGMGGMQGGMQGNMMGGQQQSGNPNQMGGQAMGGWR